MIVEMRPLRGLAATILVVCCAQGASMAQGPAPNASMDSIIASIESFEKMTADYEAEMVEDFLLGTPTLEMDIAIKEEHATSRTIFQGDYAYFDSEDVAKLVNGKATNFGRTFGYDGSRSLLYTKAGVANINTKKVVSSDAFVPHSALLRPNFVSVPLSVYLRGGPALRSHPLAPFWAKDANPVARLVSQETVGGLSAFKVEVRLKYDPGKPSDIKNTVAYLWICPDRSFLPIRIEAYYAAVSTKNPKQVGVVHDFWKLEGGVYVPKRFSVTNYNENHLAKAAASQVVEYTCDYTIKSFEPDPEHARAFFSDIRFPPGTIVYDVDGKVIKGGYYKSTTPK